MKQRLLFFIGTLILPLILVACGGQAASPPTDHGSANLVQITETDFKIDTSITRFFPGTPYHFVITNQGKIAHEFMILPKSEGNMSGMPMGNMDAMALAMVQNIAPGQTVTLDYTFPSSAAGSQPEFACHLPGHYEAGMKQVVTVKA